MEHRWGNRTTVNLPVWISGAGASGPGVLRDVSISGAYIEVAEPLANQALVSVTVHRRTIAGLVMDRTTACVVRRDQHGIGVEWCDLLPAEIQPDAPSLAALGAGESRCEAR